MASAGIAQSVEVRIVEREGRTVVTGPGDAVLNFAVQARVVGGGPTLGVSQIAFTLRIVGEPEGYGTLERGLISNADHTYASGLGVSSIVGRGGLASQHSFLANASASFNGLVNTSAGVFRNGPDQEIGLVAARAAGTPLLNTPGIDSNEDGIPDSWPGTGTPPNLATAPLPAQVAAAYFGAAVQWIDVYRFRYTIAALPTRSLTLQLDSLTCGLGGTLHYSNGVWGIRTDQAQATVSVAAPTISIQGPSFGSCCHLTTGACTLTDAGACPMLPSLRVHAATGRRLPGNRRDRVSRARQRVRHGNQSHRVLPGKLQHDRGSHNPGHP